LTPRFLPVIPADVCNGKPLKYSRTAEDYRLYSVSPNLHDDGGKVDSHYMQGYWNLEGDLRWFAKPVQPPKKATE